MHESVRLGARWKSPTSRAIVEGDIVPKGLQIHTDYRVPWKYFTLDYQEVSSEQSKNAPTLAFELRWDPEDAAHPDGLLVLGT